MALAISNETNSSVESAASDAMHSFPCDPEAAYSFQYLRPRPLALRKSPPIPARLLAIVVALRIPPPRPTAKKVPETVLRDLPDGKQN